MAPQEAMGAPREAMVAMEAPREAIVDLQEAMAPPEATGAPQGATGAPGLLLTLSPLAATPQGEIWGISWRFLAALKNLVLNPLPKSIQK